MNIEAATPVEYSITDSDDPKLNGTYEASGSTSLLKTLESKARQMRVLRRLTELSLRRERKLDSLKKRTVKRRKKNALAKASRKRNRG